MFLPLMEARFFRYQALVAIHDLRVPIPFVLDVLEKPDSKWMKCIQDRVVVVGAVLVDD